MHAYEKGGAVATDATQSLEMAPAIMAELADQFPELIDPDLQGCKDGLAAAQAAQGCRQAYFQAIHQSAHNIKGLGGSFGFHLVTEIGRSLCSFISLAEADDDDKLKVIEAHVAALEISIGEKVIGDGGEAGALLLKKLTAASARFMPQ